MVVAESSCAPIVGATSHVDEAIKALSMKLTDEEVVRLEEAYTHV